MCAVTPSISADGTKLHNSQRPRRDPVDRRACVDIDIETERGNGVGPAHHSATCDEPHQERDVYARPQLGLASRTQQRLEDERIDEQGKDTSDIAGGVKEVRITGMWGAW